MKKSKSVRTRLDQQLVQLGLVASRTQAQAWIMAGQVWLNGHPCAKAAQLVNADDTIELKVKKTFVGRGGDKLHGVLLDLGVQVADKVVLDAGISTGGFTDCLLKQGAKKIYGVDVAYGQVDWQLRQDSRVTLIERTNLRYLLDGVWGEKLRGEIDLVTLDLSFISLLKVLPTVVELLRPKGELLALVKPQFELERSKVGKGGIVRNCEWQREAVEKVVSACQSLGFTLMQVAPAPIKGRDGNQEYFVWLQQGQ